MNHEERVKQFRTIARHFKGLYRDMELRGELPYRLTSLGAWAASRPHHLFYFFSKLELGRYRLFLDLGSGDGVAACVAGLFTRAVGIEVDPGLCRSASEASHVLGLAGKVDFVCGDYRSLLIRRADCLYVYPEKPIDSVLTILTDWQGILLVYGNHFPPAGFSPACFIRCGRERITAYPINDPMTSASRGLFP